MTNEELRELRCQAITIKMCKQMDDFIDKAEGPTEVVDILIAWSQVLGAVIGTIPGANQESFEQIMEKCNANIEAAFISELVMKDFNKPRK